MTKKMNFVISIFITAVILSLIGGISVLVSRKADSTAAAQQSTGFDNTREAQYQQLIAQANETINQANQEIAALQAQNQALSAPTAAPYPITLEQAISIASVAAGGTPLQTPRLVDYSGVVAYEVVFSEGTIYIDANTGKVLYNGVQVARTITSQQAIQIAQNYTGNSQPIEVVSGIYNGVSAYRVTFQNGQIVYLNFYGSILAVQPPPTTVSSSRSEHEDDDD